MYLFINLYSVYFSWSRSSYMGFDCPYICVMNTEVWYWQWSSEDKCLNNYKSTTALMKHIPYTRVHVVSYKGPRYDSTINEKQIWKIETNCKHRAAMTFLWRSVSQLTDRLLVKYWSERIISRCSHLSLTLFVFKYCIMGEMKC